MSDADFQVKGSISLELDAQGLADIRAQAASAAQKAFSVGPATSGGGATGSGVTGIASRILSGGGGLQGIAARAGAVLSRLVPPVIVATAAIGAMAGAAKLAVAAFSSGVDALNRQIARPGGQFSAALSRAAAVQQIETIRRAQEAGRILDSTIRANERGIAAGQREFNILGANVDRFKIGAAGLVGTGVGAAGIASRAVAASLELLGRPRDPRLAVGQETLRRAALIAEPEPNLPAIVRLLRSIKELVEFFGNDSKNKSAAAAAVAAPANPITTADILRSLGGF